MYVFLIIPGIMAHYIASVSSIKSSSGFRKCAWNSPADPYLESLEMYNDLMESLFGEPRVHCDRPPPGCQGLKEIVAGERSAVLAIFYEHSLSLCNLIRLQKWTKGNLKNATELLQLRNSLLQDVIRLAHSTEKLTVTQQVVYDLVEEDLKQVLKYEQTLKEQQDTLRHVTMGVLELQVLKMVDMHSNEVSFIVFFRRKRTVLV